MSQRLVQHLLVRMGLAGATAGALGGVAVAANQNASPTRAHEAAPAAAPPHPVAGCGERARSLAATLARATGFDRLALIADGATDPSPAVRLAVACALIESADGVGLRSAIDLLARDDEPAVRRAAARAAWAHAAEDPIRYVTLLEALAADPDATVRDAVLLLRRG